MNPALLLALWMAAASALLSGQWFVHRHFTQAMKQETKNFTQAWQRLEGRYDKN